MAFKNSTITVYAPESAQRAALWFAAVRPRRALPMLFATAVFLVSTSTGPIASGSPFSTSAFAQPGGGDPPLVGAGTGTGTGPGEEALTPFEQAAVSLREWAAMARSGEVLNRHDAPLSMGVAGWLDDLKRLAPSQGLDEWGDARLAGVLLEVAVDAKRSGRVALAHVAIALADRAPSTALERTLLSAAIRIAEPVLQDDESDEEPTELPSGAQGASGGVAIQGVETNANESTDGPGQVEGSSQNAGSSQSAGSSQVAELFSEVTEWIDRVERLDQHSGSATGMGFAAQARQRLLHLSIGSPAPRFVARDTAGNEVRSTDLAGKITLIRFWSNESPASLAAHHRDTTLMRDYWDYPVELVGISHDSDRGRHIDQSLEHEFAGIQVFDGPVSAELVDALAKSGQETLASTTASAAASHAWMHPVAGSLFIVDSNGIIRGRDLAGEDLEQLLSRLIFEHRTRIRERRLTGSSQ